MTSAHLSPSALNRFLGCEYRTYLDILEKRGEAPGERKPVRMQLLFERGDRHEEAIVEELGSQVTAIPSDKDTPVADKIALTLEAMRRGDPIIHQACLTYGEWIGYPDFLSRVETPSGLGAWSYEAHDAKLTSTERPNHVFQLLFYTDALAEIQGLRPARMHLMLGGEEARRPAFDPTDFDAYAQHVREHFAERYAQRAADEDPGYPYPVSDCDFCHWWHICDRKRRDDDHSSFVANLFKSHGAKLDAVGVSTLPAVATLPEDTTVPRLTQDTLASLRAQADLQLRSRGLDRPLHEIREPEVDRGLHRLPEPSPGDVFFDFEGDQYWGEEGLEYLFGTVFEEDGQWRYWPLWATSRAEEKAAFETWMDWITARLQQHPDLHIFHFNSYEPVALKKLMALHGSREHEVDELLRRKMFVDLYGITRQAIRAGVESYGLKALEPVIGFERTAEEGLLGSMARWQRFQETGDRALLAAIEDYNADDCRSTRALYEWLLARRPEAEEQWDVELASLQPEPAKELSKTARERAEATEQMRGLLLAGLPDDESHDTEDERARRVAFTLLGYHSREAKPGWWEFFARREKTLEQLRDEDGDAIGGLELVAVEPVKKSLRWTLSYPEQDHKIGDGKVDDPRAGCTVTVESVDERTRRVVVITGPKRGPAQPEALAPCGPYNTEAQVDSLFRFAGRIAADGLDRPEAGLDLLLRHPPRFMPGAPSLRDEPFDLGRLRGQVAALHRSALVVQGPPGTGKTWTGARLAVDLLRARRKVGVVATSHKAIDNLLEAIDEAADEEGVTFRGWKCAEGENAYESPRVSSSKTRPDDDEHGTVRLIAGTAWLWAREGMQEEVDVLFVDEAGQMSLADAIAVAGGAKSVVLLGDPQQLAHVSQGTHPLGCGRSVLEHMLSGAQTVPRDRGVFLGTSWRMHPDVCGFISRAMYDDSLTSVRGCDVQRVDSPGLSGSGLRLIGVEHSDNRGRCEEEAERIVEEVARLLDGGTYVDREGVTHPLTLDDILVVAPYNAQVRCLRSLLPEGARVGTVDKFQGQEAPVVLFSMASSSGDDVSRGMSFLFSRNRLNVAVSRAQALAVVVCSPKLLGARCSTVDDMRLVNMLCRFAGEAEPTVTSGA